MKFVKYTGIFILFLSHSGCARQIDAEYAIRWKPSGSNLPTVKSLQDMLKLDVTVVKQSEFTIQLYKVAPAEDLPVGADVIARSRVEKKSSGKTEAELTIKYRSEVEIPIDVASWKCPLHLNKLENKYEVDISFGVEAKTQKRYSLSCSFESKDRVEFPAYLNAVRSGPEKSMTRYKYENITISGKKIKTLKVEEWKSDNPDQERIEISIPGIESPEDMQLFNEVIVSKVLALGIKPDIKNKSDIPD